MKPIILASASPRRKELLIQAKIPFVIKPSSLDEDNVNYNGSPEGLAERLAYLKADDIAKELNEGLVLGADTIVVLDGKIFGKPAGREEAFSMLSQLGGKEHSVITGVSLIDAKNGRALTDSELTKVRFAKLSNDDINAYIDTGEPEGKAGAYAVQGLGALLVESINGCYSNVVGLPLMRLRRMLEEFDVYPLSGI